MYGVDGPFGAGVRRATFLVSQDRRIRDAVLADVFVGKHADFIRKAIVLRDTAGIRTREKGK
jgi:peroxiredoxin